jgi:NADH:ubiquinone oxidoreductase subunit F (NADH-binding)
VADILTPVLTDNWDQERSWTLAAYEERGGYGALKKAFDMAPTRSSRRSRTPDCGAAVAPASRPA